MSRVVWILDHSIAGDRPAAVEAASGTAQRYARYLACVDGRPVPYVMAVLLSYGRSVVCTALDALDVAPLICAGWLAAGGRVPHGPEPQTRWPQRKMRLLRAGTEPSHRRLQVRPLARRVRHDFWNPSEKRQ